MSQPFAGQEVALDTLTLAAITFRARQAQVLAAVGTTAAEGYPMVEGASTVGVRGVEVAAAVRAVTFDDGPDLAGGG
jgi:hypothetical protein